MPSLFEKNKGLLKNYYDGRPSIVYRWREKTGGVASEEIGRSDIKGNSGMIQKWLLFGRQAIDEAIEMEGWTRAVFAIKSKQAEQGVLRTDVDAKPR